ncbi:ATP-grasp domain-containing protein, partial [bacterium]|nr:ATP-grasp domain-containing protein [bacterium]
SGKGQSTLKTVDDIDAAWEYAQSGGRAGAGRIIVEGFVDFDYEITLLTVRHRASDSNDIVTTFCEAIGHRQEDGDYRESWQPQAMSDSALRQAQHIAKAVTDNLGGLGIFGVELFIKCNASGDDMVYFSEVSPRPHDTGLVTLISQNLSEFALHARALLGLPIPQVRQLGPSASSALLVEGESNAVSFSHVDKALAEADTNIRLFGKPNVSGRRRMGVTLALGKDIDEAISKATDAKNAIDIHL